MADFDAFEITKETFTLYSKIYKSIVSVSLILSLYMVCVDLLELPKNISIATELLYFCVFSPLYCSTIQILSSRHAQNRNITVLKSIQISLKRILRLFWGNIIVSLALFFGALFLIFPALIFFPRLYFVNTAIAVDKYNVSEAIENSWKMTKGKSWLIYSSFLLMLIIGFVSLLLMVVIGELLKSLTFMTYFVMVLLLINTLIIQNVLMYDRLKSKLVN